MKPYVARVSTEGDLVITIPEAVRPELGLEGIKAVTVYVDNLGVTRFIPMVKTFEEVRGSAVVHGPTSFDYDEEIDEAMAHAVREELG